MFIHITLLHSCQTKLFNAQILSSRPYLSASTCSNSKFRYGKILTLDLLQIRETRKQELQEHVDSVNAMITAIIPGTSKDTNDSSDDEWEGIPTINSIDHNEEYIDEDKYTTVTVTTMNEDDTSSEDENDPDVKARKARESIYNEDGTKKDLRNSGDKKTIKEKKPKVKKKKFRYLSKGERREDQRKQKGIRSKKAYERKGTEKEKEKEKGKSKGKGKR